MKFTDSDYEAVIKKAHELIDLDHTADKVEDLLMHTPGLGSYMRKKFKVFNIAMKLSSDIYSGIKKLRV
jgi:predicted class III extradiol MEMO1 family dioxygenase